ncbi:ATP-binding protein [Catenulispora pinisilvae]|uniref:ATP-binding protein n=2 Tax=Catenulispora pinisilvae TaxID=2705253 RepID=UPI0018926100|nr:sensor histidine kinase [Catenulispora pinisilvae]
MNSEIALWCAGGALVVAIAFAVYKARSAGRLRARIARLEQACAARDAAVAQLAAIGLPTAADLADDSRPARSAPALAPILAGTPFADSAAVLAQRYTVGLGELQVAVAESVRHKAQDEARQTTESSVRSFAETVVSLGANLSKVVAQAMRQHRGQETFETLTLIDHTVQQMIRQAQSYVVVCGGLPGRRWPSQAMTDVVRGAMGRIQDYQRIRPRELDRQVIGQAVEPAVHAVATLLDNAARYSPPGSFVDVTFQEGHHGVTIIVDDAGVGMNSEQLDAARRVLSGQEPADLHRFGPHPKIGFPTVAALSKRYGFQASVDGSSSPFGGTRAALFIPEALLAADAADVLEAAPGAAPEPEPEPPEAAEVTGAGLPRRRRHIATADTQPLPPILSTSAPRPSVAAAWQSGVHSADDAAAPSDPAEGTR